MVSAAPHGRSRGHLPSLLAATRIGITESNHCEEPSTGLLREGELTVERRIDALGLNPRPLLILTLVLLMLLPPRPLPLMVITLRGACMLIKRAFERDCWMGRFGLFSTDESPPDTLLAAESSWRAAALADATAAALPPEPTRRAAADGIPDSIDPAASAAFKCTMAIVYVALGVGMKGGSCCASFVALGHVVPPPALAPMAS